MHNITKIEAKVQSLNDSKIQKLQKANDIYGITKAREIEWRGLSKIRI